jgi:hypothetical protein
VGTRRGDEARRGQLRGARHLARAAGALQHTRGLAAPC